MDPFKKHLLGFFRQRAAETSSRRPGPAPASGALHKVLGALPLCGGGVLGRLIPHGILLVSRIWVPHSGRIVGVRGGWDRARVKAVVVFASRFETLAIWCPSRLPPFSKFVFTRNASFTSSKKIKSLVGRSAFRRRATETSSRRCSQRRCSSSNFCPDSGEKGEESAACMSVPP